jgi:fatty acid desaturase
MSASSPLLQPEPALSDFTDGVRRDQAISWYRTPLPPGELKALHARSDFKGAWQTLGYVAILFGAGGATLYSAGHFHWWVTAMLFFLEGMVASFLINAVHELGHNTVFKTKGLNVFFCHLLAFFGWINHEMFQASHTRHHRYTLHPPDDLEVTLPVRLMIWHVFREGLLNFRAIPGVLKLHWRIATGKFEGDWELTLFPPSAPEKRRPPVRWARVLLAGHAAIFGVSMAGGWWLVPVLVSLAPFYGAWLFFFCNNTQHVGLQDNVSDFRLCCRTFTLNPIVRFLYWQMNYHTEHHMYAAVPCYHLGRLHQLIRHDLPPTPHGLIAVWREIGSILARQEKEPTYRKVVELPVAAGTLG